jgi:E1-E2 ATPase
LRRTEAAAGLLVAPAPQLHLPRRPRPRSPRDVRARRARGHLERLPSLEAVPRVAVDAEVVEGESSVDESMVTGESMPVAKTPATFRSNSVAVTTTPRGGRPAEAEGYPGGRQRTWPARCRTPSGCRRPRRSTCRSCSRPASRARARRGRNLLSCAAVASRDQARAPSRDRGGGSTRRPADCGGCAPRIARACARARKR